MARPDGRGCAVWVAAPIPTWVMIEGINVAAVAWSAPAIPASKTGAAVQWSAQHLCVRVDVSSLNSFQRRVDTPYGAIGRREGDVRGVNGTMLLCRLLLCQLCYCLPYGQATESCGRTRRDAHRPCPACGGCSGGAHPAPCSEGEGREVCAYSVPFLEHWPACEYRRVGDVSAAIASATNEGDIASQLTQIVLRDP